MSQVNVTRPINAIIEGVSYLPNGKAYELQTWYTDGARTPVSLTSDMTSKAKEHGRKVMWCVLAHKSRTKRLSNTEIDKMVTHPQGRIQKYGLGGA